MTGQYSGATASKAGLHEFGTCRSNPACAVWPGEANRYVKRAVFQYGYFEIKARACLTSGCAWWMVGFDDDPAKSGEIDVLEVNHDRPPDWSNRCAHFGIHPWDDRTLTGNDHIFWSTDCSELHREHVYTLSGFRFAPNLTNYATDYLLSSRPAGNDHSAQRSALRVLATRSSSIKIWV